MSYYLKAIIRYCYFAFYYNSLFAFTRRFFMRIDAEPIIQSIVLGSLFVAIAAVTDTAYAVAAGAVAPALVRARGIRALGRYLTGGAFFGLALFTALAEKRGVS